MGSAVAFRRFTIALWCSLAIGQEQPSSPNARTLTQNGITVKVTVEPVDRSNAGTATLHEGEPVTVRFQLTDTASNSPVTGASPAAWIDLKPNGKATTLEQCTGKVKRLAEGSTFSRTELDLTSFHVAILNADASLTVVDPRFGFGDTRLLALVSLESPGEDWALASDSRRLFVSLPDTGKVAVVDTASWKVTANIAAVPQASRLAVQPDGGYLWIGYGTDAVESGVAVVNTRDLKTVARIPTGHGYHQIAFSRDSSFAFVTNPVEGTVAIVDVRKLSVTKTLEVGSHPSSIAYSDLAKAAYVANQGDGTIVAIDGAEHRVIARIEAAPGLGQIRFVPGTRFGLALNPANDHVYVVDASSNRIIQQGVLDKEPDQISFTNKQAHVRHRKSDSVLMIGLDSVGKEGAPLTVADFTGGRHAPGAMSRSTPADGIVQASSESGVLVANPGDKAVYFYMEGMAAPMGNFSNYGREPRAVLVVERSLAEKSPGVYETTAKLPAAGSYDLAFLNDRPRIIGCFDLPIALDRAAHPQTFHRTKAEPLFARSAKVGEPFRFAFKLTLAETGEPDVKANDVTILVLSPGLWQRRQVAQPAGDGIYFVDFVIPKAGLYSVLLEAPSGGLAYAQYATITVQETSAQPR